MMISYAKYSFVKLDYSMILVIKFACRMVEMVSLMASAFRDKKVAAESVFQLRSYHIYSKGSSVLAPSLS